MTLVVCCMSDGRIVAADLDKALDASRKQAPAWQRHVEICRGDPEPIGAILEAMSKRCRVAEDKGKRRLYVDRWHVDRFPKREAVGRNSWQHIVDRDHAIADWLDAVRKDMRDLEASIDDVDWNWMLLKEETSNGSDA